METDYGHNSLAAPLDMGNVGVYPGLHSLSTTTEKNKKTKEQKTNKQIKTNTQCYQVNRDQLFIGYL